MEFTGFSQETIEFFKELAHNNTKEWFDEHKSVYEEFVREPSRAFIVSMGAKLKEIAPELSAIPKVNKGLFRINRDTRFSPDKSPYKTHMGLWMWEGSAKRMECSGFYFHLDGDTIMFGAGIYMFPKQLLARYRAALVEKKAGEAFTAMISRLEKSGMHLGGEHYKRVPRGFDPAHPNARYLRHRGLTMGLEEEIPAQFYSSELINYAFSRYKKMLPLHRWLHQHIAP